MQIIDNFLSKEDFKVLKSAIISRDFPYYYTDCVASENDKKNFYLRHQVYYSGVPHSPIFDLFQKTVLKHKSLEIIALLRIKINFYPRSEKRIIHPKHIDNFKHCTDGDKVKQKALILSLNTCDGATIIYDNEKTYEIASVENRALFFNPTKLHSSTNCTNEHGRFNININYI